MNKQTTSQLLSPLVDVFSSAENSEKSSLPINWEEIFGRHAPLIVEIGSGMGEVLVKGASENPQANFIAIEQIWERIYKTLKRIQKVSTEINSEELVERIKILQVDARDAFERLFEEESIDDIYCLFPCPWPKKSHTKHRLFSHDFLKLVNSRLKPDAGFKIVTDFEPYSQWVLEEAKNTGFTVDTRAVFTDYDTKFERKWKKGGQAQFFEINCRKINHCHVEVKRDVALKSYKVKSFDANSFKFENLTGDPAVVFKDIFYDEKKKVALIQVLVAEGHLSQYLRIAVVYKDEFWLIRLADGQKFFPTPGIAQALESVYKAIHSSC